MPKKTKQPNSQAHQAQLPLAKVEEMFGRYCERQTANYVAKTAGVSWGTARRYIQFGDPARGVESFRVRHAQVSSVVARETTRKVIYTQVQANATMVAQLRLFDEVLMQHLELLTAQMQKNKRPLVRLGEVAKALAVRAQIVKDLNKVETEETTKEVEANYFHDWTPEQMKHFVETGSPPPSKAFPEQHTGVIDQTAELLQAQGSTSTSATPPGVSSKASRPGGCVSAPGPGASEEIQVGVAQCRDPEKAGGFLGDAGAIRSGGEGEFVEVVVVNEAGEVVSKGLRSVRDGNPEGGSWGVGDGNSAGRTPEGDRPASPAKTAEHLEAPLAATPPPSAAPRAHRGGPPREPQDASSSTGDLGDPGSPPRPAHGEPGATVGERVRPPSREELEGPEDHEHDPLDLVDGFSSFMADSENENL